MRKQGSCLEKEIMQGKMPGACRWERPRTAWMKNIKTWAGLSVEESTRMTDRDKWRKYVDGVANPRIEDGWKTEENRSPLTGTPCFTDFTGLSICGLTAIRKRDKYPTYTPGMARLTFLLNDSQSHVLHISLQTWALTSHGSAADIAISTAVSRTIVRSWASAHQWWWTTSLVHLHQVAAENLNIPAKHTANALTQVWQFHDVYRNEQRTQLLLLVFAL